MRGGRGAPGGSGMKGIRVAVTDLETGEVESVELWNDYFVVTAGSCHISHIQTHANGTHVLTIKGRTS